MKKIFFFLIFTVFGIFLYYFLSDSYRYSLEAKAYYEMGEYEKAYKIAQEAYKIDRYNTMAFTIVTQSKISIIWKKFIEESQSYFEKINEISNKETITKADKVKIKMMLEIIMGEYKNLSHSKLLNKDLEKKAEEQYKKAEELYNGIFKK